MIEGPGDEPTRRERAVSSKPDHRSWISPEEYLEIERKAARKSQYLNGEILAMAGASRPHNLIVANLVGELRNQLRGGPCEVYASDMRVRVRDTGLYTYPDVTVVCGAADLEDEHGDTLLNPTALIEVLSPSTANDDRGWKGEHYRRIPSLREYVIVAQGEARVERYRRRGQREWLLTEVVGLDQTVELASAGCGLALRDIYERVL